METIMQATHSVEQQVKQCILKTLNLSNINSIRPDMHIRNDLGMDSMSMLTLIMNLERYIEGFNANPNYFDDSDFETVSQIVAYVKIQLQIND